MGILGSMLSILRTPDFLNRKRLRGYAFLATGSGVLWQARSIVLTTVRVIVRVIGRTQAHR